MPIFSKGVSIRGRGRNDEFGVAGGLTNCHWLTDITPGRRFAVGESRAVGDVGDPSFCGVSRIVGTSQPLSAVFRLIQHVESGTCFL